MPVSGRLVERLGPEIHDPLEQTRRSARLWGWRLAKWSLTAIVILFIGRTFQDAWLELRHHGFAWRELNVWRFGCAAVLYILAQAPPAIYWRQLLIQMGQSPAWFAAWRAYFVGHLGKYVPGKLAVVAIRASLLHGDRVDPGIAALSVFVETFTTMAVGTFLALLILTCVPEFFHFTRLRTVAAVLLAGMLVFTVPTVVRGIARIALRSVWQPKYEEWLRRLDLATLLRGAALACVSWVLMAASFAFVLRGLPPPATFPSSILDFLRVLASIGLAVVAGFVSLLPGGVGVREWVLDQLLTPELGAANAAISVILLRLIWLVTELVGAAVLASRPSKFPGRP